MATHYWWQNDTAECYWVEMRYAAGVGMSLRCPLTDVTGEPNPWYELLDVVKPDDVIYHWHPHQRAFVGRSRVATKVQIAGNSRVVQLVDFNPLVGSCDLDHVRASEPEIYANRENIRKKYPDFSAYYLPFQYRADGLRMMSNYFAKMPHQLVEQLFGADGWASGGVDEPSLEEGPTATLDDTKVIRQFLEPFRPKSDTEYIAQIIGKVQKRGRRHETLVNSFTTYLTSFGLQPGRNQAIDIGLQKPDTIIEAKVITSWAQSIRQAVGQLYEYRYFHVVSPTAKLVFLASAPVPANWCHYLEKDREIAVCWQEGDVFVIPKLAANALGIEANL